MRTFAIVAALLAALWLSPQRGQAAEMHLPESAVAGQAMTIGTSGEGEARFYLVGPAQVIQKEVRLGNDVQIKGEELRSAGRWVAILREGGRSSSHAFWVQPGRPENLNFLARPSRVPVARSSVIIGVVFVFDRYQNLVLQPSPVKFSLSVADSLAAQTATSRYGVAWVNSSSARRAGAAQFVATVGDTSVRRVVQQVASDPCNLRMHVAQQGAAGIVVETDPIRDCTGNPVPDGTIVTFIQTDSNGKSAVDARIKKGIARAQLPTSSAATITVASGVVLGNELHVGGRR